ncbi:MAG TPA: hypothetical protein VMC42_06980 [Methanoregulaceae archaeon]|nr:hypothetical protein [Methanoregulaceae archaeon]
MFRLVRFPWHCIVIRQFHEQDSGSEAFVPQREPGPSITGCPA